MPCHRPGHPKVIRSLTVKDECFARQIHFLWKRFAFRDGVREGKETINCCELRLQFLVILRWDQGVGKNRRDDRSSHHFFGDLVMAKIPPDPTPGSLRTCGRLGQRPSTPKTKTVSILPSTKYIYIYISLLRLESTTWLIQQPPDRVRMRSFSTSKQS